MSMKLGVYNLKRIKGSRSSVNEIFRIQAP